MWFGREGARKREGMSRAEECFECGGGGKRMDEGGNGGLGM